MSDVVIGTLLGGALGDALGYPVELNDSDKIARLGISRFPEHLDCTGAVPALVSDDTQMTLFSIEGILRATAAGVAMNDPRWPEYLLGAYQRWHSTQAMGAARAPREGKGPLLADPRLHARRAPGNTCLTALASSFMSKHIAIPELPVNDSKGCGAIMRSAPFGLFASTRELAFESARVAGALTHGHPSGFLSAAYFAALIFDLSRGSSLRAAIEAADILLSGEPAYEETAQLVAHAKRIARDPLDQAAIERIGGGWVGEESLAIALACVLDHRDHPASSSAAACTLWLSAAHGGDSDSTASLVGSLLGAMFGRSVFPKTWLEELEMRDLIERMGEDLSAAIRDEPIGADYPRDTGCLYGLGE